MKNLNLQEKSGKSQTVKQQKVNMIETILLNLKWKVLSLCDYSDAFILVTGDITVNARDDTYVV